MISVIIPLYNKEKTIKNTIGSVLLQTYTDFEIIVVDDGSNDNSSFIVKEIKSLKIRYYRKQNEGVSIARNYGLEKIKGEFIFFLDADDIILPDCFKILISTMEKYPEADIVCGNYNFVWNRNSNIASSSQIGYIKDNLKALYEEKISLRTGVLLFKKIIFKNFCFNPQISVHEDTDLWIKLLKVYKIAYTPQVIHEYHMDASELSKNLIDIKKEFAFFIDLGKSETKYEKLILGNNIVSSIINRIFKRDFRTVFLLLYRNFFYLPFLLFIYIKRKI